jgi:hypothetical protein
MLEKHKAVAFKENLRVYTDILLTSARIDGSRPGFRKLM